MTEKSKANRILCEIFDFVEIFIIMLFVFSMLFTFVFSIVKINGESMENTVMPEDSVIVSMIYTTPKQGDIIVINANESVTFDENGSLKIGAGINRNIVKRVIAVGGQSIDIDFYRGAVYVDGVMLDEVYLENGLTHIDSGAFTGKYPVEVPEGYVFVMGDNRSVSKDSRSADIGFVSESDIVGKVFFRIKPLENFGLL